MRRLLALAAAAATLALSACGEASSSPYLYSRNDLQLITAYTAKEMCSCLFVMEQDEEFCRAWTKASPAVASASVDFEGKAVEASALMLWSARAHWVDAHEGCVLDAP